MVVLQITDQAIRVLRGQWPNISAFAERPRSFGGDIAEEIRQILAQAKLSSGPCALLLSRREMVFQEEAFPSRDHSEILKMIALQVSSVIPYDKDQVLYDYRLIRVTNSGYSEVVIVATPDADVQKYIVAVQKAGLSVADVYLGSESTDIFIQKTIPADFARQNCSLVILAGASASEVVFYIRKQWAFSYYIPYGASDFLSHGQEAIQDILRCIDSFEKKHRGSVVESVWIIADEEMHALKAQLSILREWSIEMFDFQSFLPESVRSLYDEKKMHAAWIPLLGCLMKDASMRLMNFLPKGVYLSKAQKQGRKDVLRFCLALAIAGFFIFLLCWGILYKQAKYVESLERQSAQLDPLMEKMQSESEFLEEISRRSDARYSTVRMVKEIYELLPDDVSIQSLGMRLKGGFDLQGIAIKDQSVNQLQSALVSSAFFSRVDLQYATKRRRFDKEYTEFKIIFYPGT